MRNIQNISVTIIYTLTEYIKYKSDRLTILLRLLRTSVLSTELLYMSINVIKFKVSNKDNFIACIKIS